MTKYDVLLSSTAVKQLKDLQQALRSRIKKKLSLLAAGPFSARSGCDIKYLHGSEKPKLYRLRVGDYRVMYAVTGKQVKVTEICHRSKAYY